MYIFEFLLMHSKFNISQKHVKLTQKLLNKDIWIVNLNSSAELIVDNELQ